MLDIKLVRENPDLVKENIKKKFQEEKLALVDEVIELDKKFRESKQRADELRASRNKISKEIGGLMAKGLREEAEKTKQKVAHLAKELEELEGSEETLSAEIKKRMMVIPNIIGDDVPIGKDDSENVELQRFGEPYVVMSFSEMENMMYKIEGEDLYLIGTSEHSMIGKFIDTITPEAELPKTLTSYCARHRGARRIPHTSV